MSILASQSKTLTIGWQRRGAAFARRHHLLHDPATHALDAALKKYERRLVEQGGAGST
jgi:hypothetical protein